MNLTEVKAKMFDIMAESIMQDGIDVKSYVQGMEDAVWCLADIIKEVPAPKEEPAEKPKKKAKTSPNAHTKQGRLSNEEIGFIRENIGGMSSAEIGLMLNRSTSVVNNAVIKLKGKGEI